ncbi:hypothetical protein KCP78_15100 [Salmonella enterica subsp. enterica]|nr:hypothetical protein KCP78_15100 [Salmonella enterica subsp. enterica]
MTTGLLDRDLAPCDDVKFLKNPSCMVQITRDNYRPAIRCGEGRAPAIREITLARSAASRGGGLRIAQRRVKSGAEPP